MGVALSKCSLPSNFYLVHQFPSFSGEFDEDDEEDVIRFDHEDVDFPLPEDLGPIEAWIRDVIDSHQCQLQQVQYVFCSDDFLHRMNVEYLDHDTLTDIITFPYTTPPEVGGEMYISTDRVRDNAADFGVSFDHELRRVIIHGILHLCGFGDKTEPEEQEMRRQEERALALWAER